MTRKPRGYKIGREWMASWGDRQSQSLTELYLIVQGSAHLCPLPPLSKPPWSWGLNSAHLGNNIQIEIRREIRAKFSPTRSLFQAPTFLWRTMSLSIKEEKLFSIMKTGFPCLLTSGQQHPTEGSRMEPQAGRQMSLCPFICLFFTEISQQRKKKNRSRIRLLQPDWKHFPSRPRRVGFSLGEKKGKRLPVESFLWL